MPAKVDLKRNAWASALVLCAALSHPVLPSDQAAGAHEVPCPDRPGAGADDCRVGQKAGRFVPDQIAPGPAPHGAEQGLAAGGGGTGFAPSRIESARPPLPPLAPVGPSRRDRADEERERQAPLNPEAARLPNQDREEPVRDADHQAIRLHSGLDWDYCGPRPGALGLEPSVPLDAVRDLPIDITADRVDYDRNAELIQLQGDIEILQDDRRLEAGRASFDRRSGQVKATGPIYLESPGIRLTGESAEYNLETRRGTLDEAGYRLFDNANLRGEAERAWVRSDRLSRYRDISYTTCPPGRSDWSLKARELELDQAKGMGTARHARIRILDIPVLYSPYLHFPIDGRRRSGLLIPTFGSSDETGTDITLPYYWNIAPNMDATFMPRYMSSRGLMLGAQFRHLARFQTLEVNTEVLPDDRKAPEEGARGALRVTQNGRLGSGWSSYLDYATVSDDRYLEDFGNRLDVTSVRNLSQRADLNYAGDGWRLLGRLQEFQTVDTSIAPANRPYGQLPHIEFELDPQRWKGPIEYSFQGQYDYFDHSAAVHGNRLVAIPSVHMPLRRGFGYLIPRARLFYTGYDLVDQTEGLPDQPSHLIPSLDIDSKLIFERDTDWLGTSALQTLEPRLYYVLTPYEDQSDTPRFDTTALDFSFASLFRPNRFTGYDRIGDANRLTLGLTSRTIANRTGQELFRMSVGQVYYFDHRRVQLSGDAVDTDLSSSVAGEFSARLTPEWTGVFSAQWNPNQTEQPWEKRVLQLRYAPKDDRLINLAYRFNLGDQPAEQYEDTDISFQMPLGSRVRVVGRWLYSMLNDETVEAFAGVEVGRCCWRLRLLGQHLKRSADADGSTSVMLQLELAGLGSFGNQIDKLLERGIYGYHSD